MKKNLKKYILSLLISFAITVAFAGTNPPDPGSTPTGPPLGGGAPIGGGTFILIALGAAYAGRKIYNITTEKAEEN